MSLEQEDDISRSEDEHVQQAIALSLKSNHNHKNKDFVTQKERIPIPQHNQRAVLAQNPINTTDGGVIAHIFNNRANSAISKRTAYEAGSDSEDEVDLQAALAIERKKKAAGSQAVPQASDGKNLIDGHLPFEKLGSLFDLTQRKNIKLGEAETEEENLEGGFSKELETEKAPRPIPPWLLGLSDIRTDVKIQMERDAEINAEDKERATEDQQRFLRDQDPVIVESSDDEDDVKILDVLPPKTMTPLAIVGHETNTSIVSHNQHGLTKTNSIGVRTDLEKIEDETTDPDEVDWSESNHGEITSVPKDLGSRAEKSESPEFEEIQISAEIKTEKSAILTPQKVSSSIVGGEVQTVSPIYPGSANTISPPEKHNTDHPIIDAELDDYSDPDDQELHAQLAIEAQEYGRFASILNNKSELENQQDYEDELKSLRSQQKKDRRDADEVSQTMITECQALLRFFGLPYVTAPMEAEAQCAELVRLGLVDGVVTDDCDIFLFGGTRVYKNMFNSNKYVECYLASDIEKELSLSREHLISIAHLLGSDYTEGIPGIGPVTALEIISEFPSIDDFASWWSTAQHSTDPETSLFRKKFRRTQASKLFLPPGFPSSAVTQAYYLPEVDSSKEQFQWGVPNLEQLREFLMATIGWSRDRTDEVLVPVIRDMNRRAAEGTQSNITKFFQGGSGVGVRGEANTSNTIGRSKRMRDAVNKLKSKKQDPNGALSKTFGDEAREWALREKLGKKRKLGP